MKSRLNLCVAVLAMIALGAANEASGALIARYSFTNDATNSVDGSHNGVLHGNATVSGGALQLPGGPNPTVGDISYLDLEGNELSTMSAVTIETWGTYSSSNQGANNVRLWDFARIEVTSSVSAWPGMTLYGGDKFLIIAEGTSGGLLLTSPVSWYSDAFSHVAVTLDDSTHTASLYVNGAEQASGTYTGSLANFLGTQNYLGTSAQSLKGFDNRSSLNGSITEFRIYDSALSAEQVATSFAIGPDAVPEPTGWILCSLAVPALIRFSRRRIVRIKK